MVIPVFNQDAVVFKHLNAIVNCMVLPFELIIINDCSNDNSDKEIKRFIESINHKHGSCLIIKYYKTLWPWFESRCDDFAIREARGSHILEIQADMLIKEVGFDKKLLDIMNKDETLFAISARGTHKFEELVSTLISKKGTDISDKIIQMKVIKKVLFKIKKKIKKTQDREAESAAEIATNGDGQSYIYLKQKNTIFPSEVDFKKIGRAGFLGSLIDILPYDQSTEIAKDIEKNSTKVWYGETVIRGPLMIGRDAYILAGGFNTAAFYQGYDEHDLFLRVKEINKRVGFTPINFASPLKIGTTRKKSNLQSKIWSKLHRRIRLRDFQKSFSSLMARKSLNDVTI